MNQDDLANRSNNFNFAFSDSNDQFQSALVNKYLPDSLLDISARTVAENEPFQRVEERYDRIPEPVQRRIIYWSFPRNERDICMYSSLSRASSFNASDSQSLSFCKGLKLLESNCVENVLQVGFHLSGIVWTFPPLSDAIKPKPSRNDNSSSSSALLPSYPSQNNLNLIHQNPNNPPQNHPNNQNNQNADRNQGIQGNQNNGGNQGNGAGDPSNSVQYTGGEENKRYKVSVSFDRCKITSVTCSCDTKDIFWCHHVVALALYRIRNATKVRLRVPISETLLQMNRQQLQKFVQYLIAEHHTEVLPTAQKLADEILHHKSEINSICGAPDPTAGASKDDENSWHLDEVQVCEAVKSYLGQGSYYNSNKQLNCLFGKVREMLRAQDSNGARMLTLITEQFLNDPRLVLWKSHGTPMTEKCRQLWDQLGSLWVCIVLNPRSSQMERNHWKELLDKWSKIDVCPQEDPDFRAPARESHRVRSQREREYERNRFFRENNARNALYHQYQQQQQIANNNNYNHQRYYDNAANNPNNRNFLNQNNNNYGNSSSASSTSSDSESESDEEMDENNERIPDEIEDDMQGNQRALIDNVNIFENVRVENKEDNEHLINRINDFIEEEDNAVMNDLSIDDPSIAPEPNDADEAGPSCFKFSLPVLHSNVVPENDDSSRESMDEDAIRDEHEILENIRRVEEEGKQDMDDEYLPDQKAILKIDNLNYLELDNKDIEIDEAMVVANPENSNPGDEEPLNLPNEEQNEVEPANKNKKNHRGRDLFYDQLKPNKKLKLNNGNSVNKTTTNKAPRTIFHRALDAVNMTWENAHLKHILASDAYSLASDNSVQIAGSSRSAMVNSTPAKSNFNLLGQPLWHEPMAMCAARIDSLRSHGHLDAALRLSVSVVRTMKQLQKDAQTLWHKYKPIPQQQPPKYLASHSTSSMNDCNNSKCKDCQLNKLFEFTIHKSSYSSSSSKATQAIQANPVPECPTECHKCPDESQSVQNQQPAASSAPQVVEDIVPPPQMMRPPKYEAPKDLMPGKPKQMSHQQCMCHYHQQPQPSIHNFPVKPPNCQIPCSFAAVRPHSSGLGPPPPASMPMNSNGHSGQSSGHSSAHSSRPIPQGPSQQMYGNKYYDCSKNISSCSNVAMCQMHQKRPCIKSMCCTLAAPQEKPSSYCGRSHCNNGCSGSSKYDYQMNKYPGPPHHANQHHSQPGMHPGSSVNQGSQFCNGCMRSNCLLKPNPAQMPPPMPTPATSACKNCKPTEKSFRGVQGIQSNPNIPQISQIQSVDPKPSTSNALVLVTPPEQAKYNIVNYGASTSKSPAVAASSSSSAPGTSSNIPSGSSAGPQTASSSSSSIAIPSTSTALVPNDFKFNKKNPNCVSKCLDCAVGCEVEFPLDAVACIFDSLTEACISTSDVGNICLNGRMNGLNAAVEDSNIIAPKYKHIQVPGSKDSTETFLTLAFEAAILALGKQRIMPQGLYSQHLICKQQDQLIARLRNVDLDQLLVEIIKNLSIQMMDGGPTSGFGESIHPESVPMHTLARFLFASLLNQYPDLAFKIGLRAMRFPILENVRDNPMDGSAPPSNPNYVNSPYPRWWTLGHLESQQCSLSSTMLSASKGDKVRLASVLENARQNIHSSTHLFKLAQDAFRFATPENGPRSQTLLGVAFELGLQVMRMTLTCLNWRRREMVRWLVTCATQLGLDATISIMQNWFDLFTPTEATGPVATTIMSHSTILRLNLNIKQQEDLSSCARTLALQCAGKDPPNCALNALTLCENDPMAFEAAYHIVIDAANHIMTSSQLFTIARYMEHRGFPVRAYNLAILAMKNVHLAYNQDSHPAINDIHWACALSHTLGKAELSKMIPLVVKNVQCATVLSDILRRCSVPNPGLSHFGGHHRGNNMRSCTKLSYDREPLNQLLEAAVAAYVNTTHSRLSHISPRHYGDFIDFLSKARDTFVLARDGPAHFSRLIENITIAYKGKKKLVRQVRQRFQFV